MFQFSCFFFSLELDNFGQKWMTKGQWNNPITKTVPSIIYLSKFWFFKFFKHHLIIFSCKPILFFVFHSVNAQKFQFLLSNLFFLHNLQIKYLPHLFLITKFWEKYSVRNESLRKKLGYFSIKNIENISNKTFLNCESELRIQTNRQFQSALGA